MMCDKSSSNIELYKELMKKKTILYEWASERLRIRGLIAVISGRIGLVRIMI